VVASSTRCAIPLISAGAVPASNAIGSPLGEPSS
jgi:hypothetical protein